MKDKFNIIAIKFLIYLFLFIFFRSLCILHALYFPDVRCFDDNDKPIKIDKNYLNVILSAINKCQIYHINNPFNIHDYKNIFMGYKYIDPSINVYISEDKIYVSYEGYYRPSYPVIYTLDSNMDVVEVRKIIR